jgi:hypothetical protein
MSQTSPEERIDASGDGLGATREDSRQNPRGQITGIGGTRGTGSGTGHIEGTPGSGA